MNLRNRFVILVTLMLFGTFLVIDHEVSATTCQEDCGNAKDGCYLQATNEKSLCEAMADADWNYYAQSCIETQCQIGVGSWVSCVASCEAEATNWVAYQKEMCSVNEQSAKQFCDSNYTVCIQGCSP